jgi:hypothetical protein
MRQLHEPLTVVRLMVHRRKKPVDDNIVDKVGADRARVTEIIDLDRCWPVSEDRSSPVRGVTRKVDQDVDAIGADLFGRPLI